MKRSFYATICAFLSAMALAGCAIQPAGDSDSASPFSAIGHPPANAARANTPAAPSAAPLSSQPDAADLKTVDLTVAPSDIWTRIRQGYSIPNIDTPLVKEWEDFYSARPDYLRRTAARAGKYLYYIVEEIDARGLPSELALLPFVESSYNPWALSRSQASGLWQFIPTTGQTYNLKQDWWRDERRDPIASTRAALDYFQYLFDFHGDWQLALASYNWGEGSVKRAIEKNQAQNLGTDYLSLDMPDETRNYLPKLQAIKNIIADPDKYGIALPEIDNQPYFVAVTKKRDLDVKTAAQLAEMPLEDFKALNPSYNQGVILGSHEPRLLLPADRIGIFEANLSTYDGALSSWHSYTLERGETLNTVARKTGSTIAMLRKANNLGPRASVTAGDTLMVPAPGTRPEITLVANNERPVIVKAAITKQVKATPAKAAPAAQRAASRTHRVRRGDTLASIAHRYGTSVDLLCNVNQLKHTTSLAIGQTLQIPGG